MIPQRVSLITIGAWNLPALRQFYKNLGWTETEWSSDEYVVFNTAGGMLSIWPIEEMIKDVTIPTPASPSQFRGVTLSINVESPSEVDKALLKAKKAGAKVLTEASDAFWGGRTCSFLDPENNYWEIAYNPKSVFNERGAMIEMKG